jgi:hypothetical protein
MAGSGKIYSHRHSRFHAAGSFALPVRRFGRAWPAGGRCAASCLILADAFVGPAATPPTFLQPARPARAPLDRPCATRSRAAP